MNPIEMTNFEGIAEWIRTGGTVGLLVFASRLWVANRKLRQVERQDERKGWGELIETLTAQVERLSNQVETLQTENGYLRKEIRELHGVIDGMRRENLQVGNSAARAVVEAMPREFVPPETLASIDRTRGS